MPSANPGRKIAQVKVLKKRVILIFEGGEKLDVVPSVYADFYLYEGKTLSDKEYKDIQNSNDVGKFKDYAFGLLAVRSYSTKQIIDRLYKKKANPSMISTIIEQLTTSGLLDDDEYVADFLIYAKDRHYGQRKIKEELFRDGISEKRISALVFEDNDELEKAMELLPAFLKKYDRYSNRSRHQRIYDAYLNKGFTNSVINKVLDRVPENDKTLEKEALAHDYEKAMRLYTRRFKGEKLRTHLVNNLAQKGYNYEDIKWILEEHNHGMD